MSQLEDLFEFQLKAMKIAYRKQQQLAKPRKYSWDFVVGDLAIEINGQTFQKGGHSSGIGIQRDYDKAYTALLHGWKPLSLSAQDVKSGEGLRKVQTLIS